MAATMKKKHETNIGQRRRSLVIIKQLADIETLLPCMTCIEMEEKGGKGALFSNRDTVYKCDQK